MHLTKGTGDCAGLKLLGMGHRIVGGFGGKEDGSRCCVIQDAGHLGGGLAGVDGDDHRPQLPAGKKRGDRCGAVFREHQHPVIGTDPFGAQRLGERGTGRPEIGIAPAVSQAIDNCQCLRTGADLICQQVGQWGHASAPPLATGLDA